LGCLIAGADRGVKTPGLWGTLIIIGVLSWFPFRERCAGWLISTACR
jgi:hypothetical protein